MGQDLNSATKFLDRFADAWAANDGHHLAEFFLEDGTLINPFGQRAAGRAAVGAMYAEYFTGILAGTTTTIHVESVRALGAAAFVDAEQTIADAEGAVVLAVHLSAVLDRDGEEWCFADSRPYVFAPLPA